MKGRLRLPLAALLTAAAALSIVLGCNKTTADASAAEATQAQSAPPKCATCVIADEKGFTPTSVALKAGKKGETRDVTFTRTSDETCARDIVFPELGIKEALPLNKPVTIKVPVDSARTLTFQCGMGMYKSSVVITAS